MSESTNIEWADSTWSPWRGCTKVSEGCANCYAETLAKSNPAVLGGWGKGAPRVLNKDWNKPRRWNKAYEIKNVDCIVQRPRIFPSLCDWLDDEVPIEWLANFLELIHDTPNLDWLLLTKRPENWKQRLAEVLAHHCLKYTEDRTPWPAWNFVDGWINGSPPSNVWFGVSVENQRRADERVPMLLDIPAKLRWLSLEPLLGPVHLPAMPTTETGGFIRPLDGQSRIDWLVVGGESGPGARICNTRWIYDIVRDASLYNVPVFVKQIGAFPITASGNARHWITDKKGGDPSEWPDYLRVRQMPEG